MKNYDENGENTARNTCVHIDTRTYTQTRTHTRYIEINIRT